MSAASSAEDVPSEATFSIRQLEERVLRTDAAWLKAAIARVCSSVNCDSDAVAQASANAALLLAEGKYTEVLATEAGKFLLGAPRDSDALRLEGSVTFAQSLAFFRARASAWLEMGSSEPASCCTDHMAVVRASLALWVAVACLNLYFQVGRVMWVCWCCCCYSPTEMVAGHR